MIGAGGGAAARGGGGGGELSLDGERVAAAPFGAIQGSVARGAARLLALPPPPPAADRDAAPGFPPFPRGAAFEQLADELAMDDPE